MVRRVPLERQEGLAVGDLLAEVVAIDDRRRRAQFRAGEVLDDVQLGEETAVVWRLVSLKLLERLPLNG